MKPEAHGGDLLRMAATAGRDPASLLDFSVNVRPEGPPEFIRAALFRAMTALAAYPSPHAEEAMLAAARHHGMDASRFVFGSGSNELIHALARVLRKRGVPSVRVVEPAFSEYAIACRLAGIKAIPVWGGIIEKNQCVPTTDTGKDEAVPTRDLLDALTYAPEGSAVFLANPGNPSGCSVLRTNACASCPRAPISFGSLMKRLSNTPGRKRRLPYCNGFRKTALSCAR